MPRFSRVEDLWVSMFMFFVTALYVGLEKKSDRFPSFSLGRVALGSLYLC